MKKHGDWLKFVDLHNFCSQEKNCYIQGFKINAEIVAVKDDHQPYRILFL